MAKKTKSTVLIALPPTNALTSDASKVAQTTTPPLRKSDMVELLAQRLLQKNRQEWEAYNKKKKEYDDALKARADKMRDEWLANLKPEHLTTDIEAWGHVDGRSCVSVVFKSEAFNLGPRWNGNSPKSLSISDCRKEAREMLPTAGERQQALADLAKDPTIIAKVDAFLLKQGAI